MPADFAAGALAGIRLIHCDIDEEAAKARAFRDRVFLAKRNVVFSRSLERRRDVDSHVFVLERDGAPVATARCQPYPSNISTIGEFRPRLTQHDADSEVGRIAAVGSPLHSLMLLVLGSKWLLESTAHRRFIAYCHPKLVPMYARVGATDTGERCAVPNRDREHHIVVGTYRDCARLGLEMLGISGEQAASAVRWNGPQISAPFRLDDRETA
jgi:hypothetical protein